MEGTVTLAICHAILLQHYETARCNMPHNHTVAQHFLANAQCYIPLATLLTIFVEQPIKLCYLYIVFSLYSTSK